MARLRFQISMSLDGFVAGPNQSEQNPLGRGGMPLHQSAFGQQYLGAGLSDEMRVRVVPVLLGDGARLFDNLGAATAGLEGIGVIEAPGVTHLRYRPVQ